MMSSASSMPTESRTRPSRIPISARSASVRARCEEDAGWSAMV